MLDLLTFIVSIIGICSAIIYLHVIELSHEKYDDSDKAKRKLFISKIFEGLKCTKTSERLKGVLKDYEITNREIERRENITLLIGTILITGSILILGNTANINGPKFPYALASILLFIIWLFVLHLTTKELDNMSYPRARDIEEALSKYFEYRFGIHSFLFSKTQKNGKPVWWLDVRRAFWAIILILISSIWLILALFRQ